MRRIRTTTSLAVMILLLGACGGSSTTTTVTGGVAATTAGDSAITTTAGGDVTNLTLWVGFSGRELEVITDLVAEYDQAHPEVTVEVVGGIDDDGLISALRGGNAPDVASTFTSANVGSFCGSGGLVDLGPYMAADGITEDMFTPGPMYYTQFNGVRCALPMLADAYGFYYNKTLFEEAGLNEPPTTISQLTEYAKTLTQQAEDGTIDVLGFNPSFGFYQNTAPNFAKLFGAEWVNDQGASILGQDAAWSAMLEWQKSLVDYFGYENLVDYQAGAGDEFSAANAFETGKLAMAIDGEWRVAFIAAEAPDLNYGTAPVPVADDRPELYGSGYINGTIIGIPHNSPNPDLGWELLKYLTTDDHALAQLSNGLRNVPSTLSSLESPELTPDENFAIFLDIFAHPMSTTTPITKVGAAYGDLATAFVASWQAGEVADLQAGLADLDAQIDAQLAQAGG
jgi:multiple sugar transport system substrate-binding protein